MEVHFRPDSMPSYSTTKDLIQLLRRHYLPLFDKTFLDLYKQIGYYSSDLRFIVNGQTITPGEIAEDLALGEVKKFKPRKARKMIGYGLFGLAKLEYPLGSDICGVLLCTHGKVIKADLLNQFPGSLGPRLFGLAEVPKFIDFLTTAKTDFISTRGKKYKQFQDLYNPIKQEFKAWLVDIGIQPLELMHTDEARKLEMELKKLVEDIPELGEFFGFWSRKTVLQKSNGGAVAVGIYEGVETTFPTSQGVSGRDPGPLDIGDKPGSALLEDQKGSERAEPISRTARRGPKISFVSAPDRLDLAWVDGNHVVINSGHPSYTRVRSNATARRLHCFFALGTAVQRFIAAADNSRDLTFIDRLMAAWGRK